MVDNTPTVYDTPFVYNGGGNGKKFIGRYYFETSATMDAYLKDYIYYGGLSDFLNGYVPTDITGHDFEINIISKVTDNYSNIGVVAFLGLWKTPNYTFYAIHYDTGNKEIWIGAPNNAGSGWQTSEWAPIELSFNTYYRFNLTYKESTKQFQLKINELPILTTTLSQTPKISAFRFAFGHNHNKSYYSALTTSLIGTYCKIDDELVWGNTAKFNE